jgi:hypothetical protein
MSKYTKEIVQHQGREVACYSRENSDFKCYMEPIHILEIYPGSRETTLDKLYVQWLAQQPGGPNHKPENK